MTAAGNVLRRTTATARRGERPPPLSPVDPRATSRGGEANGLGETAGVGGTIHRRPDTAPRLLQQARASAAGVGTLSMAVSPVKGGGAGGLVSSSSPLRTGSLQVGAAPLGGTARTFVKVTDGTTVAQPAPTAAVMDSGAVARARRQRIRNMRDACRRT